MAAGALFGLDYFKNRPFFGAILFFLRKNRKNLMKEGLTSGIFDIYFSAPS